MVMVKLSGVPIQPLAVGVTVIVAVTVVFVRFVATKLAISPLPLPASPIEASLFVQAKVVPLTGLVKLIAEVFSVLQYVTSETASTVAVGYTVMVMLSGVPTQPLAVGVTVIVAVTVALVRLAAAKLAMSPLPLAANPIEASLLVQAKVVPATGLVKFIATVFSVLQYVTSVTASTIAVGYTVIVKLSGVPVQPFELGVTVIVAVTVALLRFVATKLVISPVPLVANPIEASLFVQA